jgi:hypothetical protein
MIRTATRTNFGRIPKTYRELVAELPPRPIHDDVDLRNALEMIDRLAGFQLNADQEDYSEAISTFIEVYETARFPTGEITLTPLDALKAC